MGSWALPTLCEGRPRAVDAVPGAVCSAGGLVNAPRKRRSSAGREATPRPATPDMTEPATRTHHPSQPSAPARRSVGAPAAIAIPDGVADCDVVAGKRCVRLTNLTKLFWPEAGHRKRDLLQ